MRDQDQDKSILIFLLLFLTRLALIVARPVRGLHSWEFSKENSRGCVSVLISYSLLFGIYYDLSGPNTFVCLEPRFIYIKKKVIIKIYKKRKEKGKEENDHQGQLPDTIIHPKKKKKKRKSVIEVRHGSIYPGKKKKKTIEVDDETQLFIFGFRNENCAYLTPFQIVLGVTFML